MGFRLDPGERSVGEAMRRIAVERIDDAIGAIDDDGVPPDEAVHTVRKRCKEMRALLRLIGPAFSGASRENRVFRDIARGLSGHRDAAVMDATFRSLVDDHAAALDGEVVAAVRTVLAAEVRPSDAAGTRAALATAREALAEARARASVWPIEGKGWRVVGDGLETTFRKARKGMRKALAAEDAHLLHEWRKDAKYHMNQMKVMRPLWPDVLKPTVSAADDLAEDLGSHHDLNVLAAFLQDHAGRFGGPDAVAPLVALCRTRQRALEAAARGAGERLFAEKPGAFARRIRACWSAWRHEGRPSQDAAMPSASEPALA